MELTNSFHEEFIVHCKPESHHETCTLVHHCILSRWNDYAELAAGADEHKHRPLSLYIQQVILYQPFFSNACQVLNLVGGSVRIVDGI